MSQWMADNATMEVAAVVEVEEEGEDLTAAGTMTMMAVVICAIATTTKTELYQYINVEIVEMLVSLYL